MISLRIQKGKGEGQREKAGDPKGKRERAKGKAYNQREKGKAGDPKGKREKEKTRNLTRDSTRQPDRAHARTTRNETISRLCSLPPTSDIKNVNLGYGAQTNIKEWVSNADSSSRSAAADLEAADLEASKSA